MKRGEIFHVELPEPKGSPGHEQYGHRPAVVIEYVSANLSTVVIVPISKNLKADGVAGAFAIQPSPENGLSLPSVILTYQIRAIDKKRIGKQLGALEAPHLQRLEQELRSLLCL